MYLSIGVILVTGMIAYIWSARGFFSAFLHMLCVIVAGALAFAMWEPIAHWILSTNTTGGAAGDLAWGAALGIPFCVLLIILRVACDKLVPFNLDFDVGVNVVGGLVCGLVSAVLSAGLLVLSVGYMRLDTKFMDHQRVEFGRDGSLVRQSGLWLPADWIAARFYSMLSNGPFLPTDTDNSLGRLHPNLEDENWLMRMTWEEGKGRNTTGVDSFEVINHYSYSSANADEVADDHINDDPKDIEARAADKNRTAPKANPQSFTYLDGTPANFASSTIEGYGVKFNSAAKEQSGRVIVGSGQISLLVQRNANDPYDTFCIHPLAVISQANLRGDDILKDEQLGRWRFDATSGVFIPAAREGNDTFMAFDFVVPQGAKPLAMYVKGIRHDVQALTARSFTTQLARDEFVRSKQIKIPGNKETTKPLPGGPKGEPWIVKNWDQTDQILLFGDTLPLNIMLQKDIMHDLVVDPDTRAIMGGPSTPSKFSKAEIANLGVDRALQVRKLAVNDGSSIVKIRVDARNTGYGFLSKAAAGVNRDAKIVLTDTNGAEYSPIGYLYRTSTTGEMWIYFNPQAPVMSMRDKEMPGMSTSRPDQELFLIFWVSKNTKLKDFRVGDQVLGEFAPPIDVK